MIYTQIRYIAMLGPQEEPKLFNVPQESLNAPLLRFLGYLPQSMFHFVYGVGQYKAFKGPSLQAGYDLFFMHPDATQEEVEFVPWSDLNTPIVLLMCTEDKFSVAVYNKLFCNVPSESVLCVVPEDCLPLMNIPCTVVSEEEQVWRWLIDYANNHYEISQGSEPFSVPIFPKTVRDFGDVFSPSRVNTQTLNAIQGNWGFSSDLSKEELLKMRAASSEVAFSDREGSSRQKLLVEQIRKIRRMETVQGLELKEIKMLEEYYRAPLVIGAPYTSIEMRKVSDKKSLPAEDAQRALMYEWVMDAEYSKSYTVYKTWGDEMPREELKASQMLNSRIVDTRMTFMDNVAMLHCSIRFSPYFRMPILGKNINAELSFVGIKNLDKIAYARTRNQSIRKAMTKIGQKIASTALCPETINCIKNDCAQIVALTDLPIEWMMLDGVPLGFSHDVCRLPETPVQSLMSQYLEAKLRPYIIPKDILNRTLVVYGNNDSLFLLAQEAVEELKERLHFETRRCLTKQAFFDAVKEINPDLLIVDCHGGINPDTHQSYIMMGDDIVAGDDVVQSGIHPRLVFLSACNTFTAYNSVGIIANAFFEVGANAVTTSYMPLDVLEATTLYIRLISNLSIAANKDIHRNWLSFISYLLRTSYIYAPMLEHKDKMTPALSKALADLSTKSMLFENRRKLYAELNNNAFTSKVGANYDHIIPHYLMYSTLGRADLIRFQSFLDTMTPEEDDRLIRDRNS